MFGRRTVWATFAVAASAALLFAAPALAAPPDNDAFANAETLPSALPQTISGTTLDATAEPGEPADSYSGPSASVWYAWTPDADVRAKLELCGHEGAQFESGAMKIKAAVHTGTAIGSLTEVTDNLNGCRLNFDAEQGQQYFIVVDTPHPSDEYEGPFQVLLRELAPPSNDDLADAQVLAQVPEQTVGGSTVDSTMEPDEYSHMGRPVWPPDGQEGSVWYQWSSDSKGGTATFDACTGGYTALQVYSGSAYGALSGASEPGHEYQDWGSCNWTIKAAPSTTYSVAAASTRDGTFDLKVTYQPNDDPPPPPGDSPTPPAGASASTGQVAGAVKKCKKTKKKKHRKARKSCAKRAKRLGV